MTVIIDEVSPVSEASVESSASAVHWGAIVGGALAAVGITMVLITLAPGLGLATVSPWAIGSSPPATFGIVAGIWLIITQWLSSALGGYIAGRLREKWVGVRTDEILFRDTAHGFLAWALATLIVVILLTIGGFAATAGTAAAGSAAPTVTTEAAQKAATAFSFFTSLSLLIGAFIGCAAGALGGYHRDES